MSAMQVYSEAQLRSFAEKVFRKIGCSNEDAIQAADVLICADLRGIDSHGVARLSGYVRLHEAERVRTKPDMRVVHETPSTATLDADEALGLVSGPYAMKIAMEKARNVGSGWVAVENSNHFGIAAYHAMMALEEDMIGIAMTNASPLVAPTHSIERMLGTNPMCFAWPAKGHAPFVADLATAAAANGKLEIAQRTGKKIPDTWVQGRNGEVSSDPNELKKGGSLLTLGSTVDNGSHKGYALSAVVDLFSGVLSGANFGPWVPPFVSFLPVQPDLPGKGLGHFFGVLRVDAFRPKEDYFKSMEQWINRFQKAERKDPGVPVIIPGEPEAALQTDRKVNGIPLVEAVVKDLEGLAGKFGLSL
ncbi:MAG: Ldh family oxidoreductase [Bacteroidetes bacterium]|nr:Ldh family oxidoreductase [Bacteroidota bacterium]